MMQTPFMKLIQSSSVLMKLGINLRYFSHQPRTPLIKFLGKRDPKKPVEHASSRPVPAPTPKIPTPHASNHETNNTQASSANKKPAFVPKPIKPHHPNAVDYFQVKNGVMHGRKRLSAEEMEAIELGGAY